MTPIAPDESRELEDDTRQAWSHYSERLRECSGDEYERAESASWEQLQDDLMRLQERRELLETHSA